MRKVYIVSGSTGEYSDHQEWYVAAYLSEVAAANRVQECQLFANELMTRSDERYEDMDKWDAALRGGPDPGIQFDYTGTQYAVHPVDLVDG